MIDALRTAAEAMLLLAEEMFEALRDGDKLTAQQRVTFRCARSQLRTALAEARQPAGETEPLHKLIIDYGGAEVTLAAARTSGQYDQALQARDAAIQAILALFAAREAAGRRAGLEEAAKLANRAVGQAAKLLNYGDRIPESVWQQAEALHRTLTDLRALLPEEPRHG